MSKARRVLYWHRTDLRLHDSPALAAALKLKPDEFYPVWTWDPHYVFEQSVGVNRWQFLLDSMKDLSSSYTRVNPRSQLFVVRGPPTTVLPALWREWGITDIVWEKDDDAYTKARDDAIQALAAANKVKVHIHLGHTLFDASEVLEKNKGVLPKTYTAFRKAIALLPRIADAIPAPTSLPNPGSTSLSDWSRKDHSVEQWKKNDVNGPVRKATGDGEDGSFESIAGPSGKFEVPTMEELGMVATSSVRGGETRALEVFEAYMKDEENVSSFHKPQTSPAQFDPPSTTQLSPHMKFGTLSVRTFYHRVMDINSRAKTPSAPPESLIGQLLWREFYHLHQAATPNYNTIRGNAISRYIAWDLQTCYDDNGQPLSRSAAEAVYKRDEPVAWEKFQAWKEGRTGFPWIDALMRQLKAEGWLHHLGRHSVACFLTRGQLYVSWERGADVFDEYLVDWDPALNAGNWMWLSASAYFNQYFRVYSPSTYGQKSDCHGALIRKYCPELSKFDDKYIYEPWKASAAEQKKAGCVIGKDYPERIVDANDAKTEALRLLKASYDAKMHGDDPRVLDGTADAYIETFLAERKPKTETGAAKGKRKADAEEVVGAGSAKKRVRQTKLNFAKEEE